MMETVATFGLLVILPLIMIIVLKRIENKNCCGKSVCPVIKDKQ